MRGIISRVLRASIKRGMSLKVVERYLRMKYKIAVSVVVLTNRIHNLSNDYELVNRPPLSSVFRYSPLLPKAKVMVCGFVPE